MRRRRRRAFERRMRTLRVYITRAFDATASVSMRASLVRKRKENCCCEMERDVFSSPRVAAAADRDRGVRAFLRDEVLNKPKRVFAACIVCSEIVLFVGLLALIFRSGGSRPDMERIDAIAEKLRQLKNTFEKFNDVLSLPSADGAAAASVFRKSEADDARLRDAIVSTKQLLNETIALVENNNNNNTNNETEKAMQNITVERWACSEEVERCFNMTREFFIIGQNKLSYVLDSAGNAMDDWTFVIDRRIANATVAEDWKERLENETVKIQLQTTEANSTLVALFAFLKEIKQYIVDAAAADQ